MGAFPVLTRSAFKIYLRDRQTLFWGFFFPLFMMSLLGLVFTGQDSVSFEVGLAVEGPGPLARGLEEALGAAGAFRLHQADREAELAALREGDRTLVVIVPAGAGATQTTRLEVYYDQGDEQASRAALGILRGVVQEMNRRLLGVPDPIVLEPQAVAARHLRYIDFLLPGIMALVIMQSGVFSVAANLVTLRETGVLKRLRATPLNPLVFLGAQVTRLLVTTLLQVGVLIATAVVLFRAQPQGSPLAIAALTLTGASVFLIAGFSIAGLATSQEGAVALVNVVNMPMMFLSGVFFPKEFMPAFLRPVIEYLPLTPLVDGLRRVTTEGASLAAETDELLLLLGWGVVALLAAARLFRWEQE